jgi:uroporphyrin-III C-methyltransferase
MNSTSQNPGKVFIVGAGPGADDLVTLRGLRVLRQADVVLYDALLSAKLLEEAPAAAERVFVGKRCGQHSMEQEKINALLVERAREGKIVVRLKGGDPLVFGHGGEEALACVESGTHFEIVPGISSALGAASCAGVPLTHRGVASSVAFVTAHAARCADSPDLGWNQLATAVDTLVIFMGGSWLDKIATGLIEAGLARTTPVAVVSNATCENQKTVLGALETIADDVVQAQVKTPMLIIVGKVAQSSALLNWSENQRQTVTNLAEGGLAGSVGLR